MKKTKLYLSDIVKAHPYKDYMELYNYICKLIDKGDIAPVKKATMNGKKPALPLAFWQYEKETDYSDVYNELDYDIHPLINTEYYKKHPQNYAADADKVRLLSNYFKYNSELLSVKETMNERSFEIFNREKFFQKGGGVKFCKRLGIDIDRLNYYKTSEPLSYYSHSKQSPQNILIIENKDTFYDIRRYLQNSCESSAYTKSEYIQNSGDTTFHTNTILGIEFNTIIYGAGKGIWSSFEDYADRAESYFTADNRLFYFGDIDYEGILIYENLVERKWKDTSGRYIDIKPFVSAYELMLDKAEKKGFDRLPDTKENQNTNIAHIFLDFFSEKRQGQIMRILEAGRYIPQEILNEHDWCKC